MNRKRIFSLLLCSTLVFTSFAPTFAAEVQVQPIKAVYPQLVKPADNKVMYINNVSPETEKKVKISKEKALELGKDAFKKYFNTNIEDAKFTVRISLDNYNNGSKDDYNWNLSWEKVISSKNINYSIAMNANTGKIQAISNSEYNREDQNSIPAISLKEARVVADNFVKKIEPDKFKDVSRIDNDYLGYYRNGSGSYSFSYIRKVNGVEFNGNSLEVNVDGISGKVIYYYSNWNDEYTFPDAKSVISKDKAQDILKNNLNMNLKYVNYYDRYDDSHKKKEIKVVYAPSFKKGNDIDAITGNFINDDSNNTSNLIVKDLNEIEKTNLYKKYSEIKKLSEPISAERAETLMKEIIKELYGDEYKLDPISYDESSTANEGNEKTWSVQFYKDENKKYEDGGSIRVDASTERLISCYKNSPYEDEKDFKEKLTWDEAYNKAIDTVSKYYPAYIKNIKTEQTHFDNSKLPKENQYKERYFNFNFVRVEKGIEYYDNNLNITVDVKTGEVKNINYRWEDDLKFPSLDKKISDNDAVTKFMKKYNTKLTYNLVNTSKDITKPKLEPQLIYAIDYYGNRQIFDIDALNGKFVSYDGEEINENTEDFMTEIKTSKYEKEISILAYKGLLNTKEFKLKKEVTQIDLIKALVDAKGFRPYVMMNKAVAEGAYADKMMNPKDGIQDPSQELIIRGVTKGTEDYKYLQMAVSYGIIDNEDIEFKGDKKITREEMAKTLVRFINYQKLAQLDIFKSNFKDVSKVSKENLGYVAIAEGFGLIQLDKGNFNPKNISTMEELSMGIYKSLNNVRFNNYPMYY